MNDRCVGVSVADRLCSVSCYVVGGREVEGEGGLLKMGNTFYLPTYLPTYPLHRGGLESRLPL